MDNIVREIVKTKLFSLKGIAFQDSIDRIFLCIYGEENFQRVKQKRDGGSDGIINSNNVLAAYAPEKYNLADFKKKIKGDFDSYQSNWEISHNQWQVVTNLEATAQMVQFVKQLKDSSNIICIEGLLNLISKQTWTVKLAIFRALDIPEKYLSNDLIARIIEDLIQLSDGNIQFSPYERPSYIEDKINLNVANEHKEVFLEEYEESLASFSIVSHVIKSTDQKSVAGIRSKIRSTYTALSGSFEERLVTLVENMAQEKNEDDFYKCNMRIVMLYFFEQCLYGQKPSSEVSNA